MKKNVFSPSFFFISRENLEKVKYAEGSEMEGKENPGHIKIKHKPNTKMHDQKHAHSVFFLKNTMPKPNLLPFSSGHPICRHLYLAGLASCPCLAKEQAAFGGSRMEQEEMLRLHSCSFSFSFPHFHF